MPAHESEDRAPVDFAKLGERRLGPRVAGRGAGGREHDAPAGSGKPFRGAATHGGGVRLHSRGCWRVRSPYSRQNLGGNRGVRRIGHGQFGLESSASSLPSTRGLLGPPLSNPASVGRSSGEMLNIGAGGKMISCLFHSKPATFCLWRATPQPGFKSLSSS